MVWGWLAGREGGTWLLVISGVGGEGGGFLMVGEGWGVDVRCARGIAPAG